MPRRPKPPDTGERPEELPVFKCGRYGHVSRRTKKLCQAHVIDGTKSCRSHGGKPVEQQKAEGALRIEFSKWQLDGHDGTDLDPRIEILRLIAFWKHKANFYGGLLQQAYEAAEQLRAAHAAGKLILADEETEIRTNEDGGFAGVLHEAPHLQVARANLEKIFIHGGVTALVGEKYDVDRDGRIFAVDEGIRGLVTLEERAHTMVGKFCKDAVQAKIAETRIEMAQQVGVMIQMVIIGVLRDLGVAAMDARVQQLIVAHIDQATTGQMSIAA